MASFVLTGTTGTTQVLLDGETGFVGVNGAIAAESQVAVNGEGFAKLTVLGAIQAFSTTAIDHDGTDLVMDIGQSGYVGSSTSDAVNALVTNSALVNNFGTIRSDSDGLDLRDNDGAALIRVVNHGTISGQSDGLVLQSGSGTTTIINTGIIEGQSYGIYNAFAGQSATTTFDNSGTVIGLTQGYGGDDSTDVIRNTGLISGGIDLDGGDDIYDGEGGQVIGVVTGELGNDELSGGAYADNFNGGDGDDILRGRGGDDLLIGGNNADLLVGGSGDDTLRGGGGADKLRGGKDDDTLVGNNGNDDLRGGVGDDSLNGGGGIDSLAGGKGNDELTGGAGSDVFVFGRKAEDDVITDFVDGVDQIDLTAFGLRPVDFAGIVQPALSNAGDGATFLDLDALGGNGSVLIEGLAFANADASDFIL